MPHPRPALVALVCVACTALACGLYEFPIDFDNTVPVVRAMRDLPPGVALVEEDLYVVESPAGVPWRRGCLIKGGKALTQAEGFQQDVNVA
jgi:hypothetical protein